MAPAGERSGDDADEDDLERQLVRRPPEEEDGSGRDWLSYAFPIILALPVFVILVSVAGVFTLPAGWAVYLIIILAAAAGAVALYRRNLWRSILTPAAGESRVPQGEGVHWQIGGEGVHWLVGGEEDENLEGLWVKRYENGNCYEGEFVKGKFHGLGVMKFHHGARYAGEWKEGLPNGFGVEILPARGGQYCGKFKDGSWSGFGKLSLFAGEWFAGEWLGGRPNGRSSHRSADGNCYYGEFINGRMHGLGRVSFRNGNRYAGEYFGNKFQGYGLYQYANGGRYEGSFHEGRIQGLGMSTSRNGDVSCGEWNSNILKNPHPRSSERVIEAVKSAQIAAEKASGLPFPDEDVESAVEFATAMATGAQVTAENAVKDQRRRSILAKYFGWLV